MKSGFPLFLAVLGLNIFGTPALSAPQTFNTALPVAEGEFVTREFGLLRKRSDGSNPLNRKVDIIGGVAVLGYGITGDLSAFGVLPALDKKLKLTTPAGLRVTRKTRGIGDAKLFARYTIFKDNAPGRTLRIAPFAGIELPTGDNKDRDFLGRLPPTFQLGSGSWDPFGGVVATYQTLDFEIDVEAGAQFNSRADGFEFGDIYRLDASLQYRLWPRELTGNVSGFFYGVIEGNLVHKRKNRISGLKDPNSGGTSLFVAPGVQYVTRRWIAEAIVQIPVLQDLNGGALRDDFIARAGIRFNF